MQLTHARYLVLLFTLVSLTFCAQGQTAGESGTLREDVAELKESQKALEQELRELKEILAPVLDRLPKPFRPQDVSVSASPALGDNTAKITLVEFSDLQCPYCVRFYDNTFPEIVKHYVDTGMVRYVAREFPLTSIHKEASRASQAALCAGDQGKYWEMRGKVFANRDSLSEEALTEYAVESGLELDAWRACLESDRYAQKVQTDMKAAARLGINGTPSFVLGLTDPDDAGKFRAVKMLQGAVPFPHFEQAIDDLLQAPGEE